MNNKIIVVTGQRGKGKTTYIKNTIENYDRVIIFDLLGEFSYYETALNLEDFFSLLSKKRKEDFFIINYYNPKNTENDFNIICKVINKLNDIMFVVDELDYFCSANYIPKEFSEIIKRGRHQNLNILIATRRPHEIPRLVTSQLTDFITFRQIEPRDLNYIKDAVGIDAEEIQNLKDFHYLKWSNGIIEKGEVIKNEKVVNLKDFMDKKFDYFDEDDFETENQEDSFI